VRNLTLNAVAKLQDASFSTTLDTKPRNAIKFSAPRLETISTVEDLRKIETEWRELEADNRGRTTVFQSFDWIMAWCNAYLQNDQNCNIVVITGFHNAKLVFVLPLTKSTRFSFTVLDWLTHPIGQYGDALCATGEDPQKWMDAAFSQIAKMKGIDLVRLRHVRDNGNAASFAMNHMQNAKYNERAPYLDLSLFKTEADYEARYTSTQRKRRKKIRKSLEEKGEVSFRVVTTEQERDLAIDQSIIEKNAWLSDRGRFNRIMGCPRHVTFLKNVSRISNDSFCAVTTEIKAGGEPVSWEIGFRYHGTHFAYITSHVNALTDLSPGRLHMDLSQRLALADGQKTFDLMVPYDVHKESWSSGTIPANDYFKAMSLSGWIYGQAYLKTLRPLLRRLYYSLPPKALRLLQPITRH
jgi:CelD/BcsL family acetyltransferase involved in cellulose biosynthesis